MGPNPCHHVKYSPLPHPCLPWDVRWTLDPALQQRDCPGTQGCQLSDTRQEELSPFRRSSYSLCPVFSSHTGLGLHLQSFCLFFSTVQLGKSQLVNFCVLQEILVLGNVVASFLSKSATVPKLLGAR